MKAFITLASIVTLCLSPAAAEEAKPSAKVEAVAKTLLASQKSRLLTLLNEGDEQALQAVPGVGPTRATAIKKARPYADVTEVLRAEGIGDGTFAKMVAHANAGFPQPEAKKAPAKKKATARGETEPEKKTAE